MSEGTEQGWALAGEVVCIRTLSCTSLSVLVLAVSDSRQAGIFAWAIDFFASVNQFFALAGAFYAHARLCAFKLDRPIHSDGARFCYLRLGACRCPDRTLNTLYYFLICCVNVVMLAITVRAQLTRTHPAKAADALHQAKEAVQGDADPQYQEEGSLDSGHAHTSLRTVAPEGVRLKGKKVYSNSAYEPAGSQDGTRPPDGAVSADSAMQGDGADGGRKLRWGSESKDKALTPGKEGGSDPDEWAPVEDQELDQSTHSIVIKVGAVPHAYTPCSQLAGHA